MENNMLATRPQTDTESEQVYVEEDLAEYLTGDIQPLLRDLHVRYLLKNIQGSPESNQGLHCSRPWMVYWTLHAADVLGCAPDVFQQTPRAAIAQLLMLCFQEDLPSPQTLDGSAAKVIRVEKAVENGANTDSKYFRGGFAGGPSGQIPHLATTYASVCSFAILGLESAFNQIPRKAIERWLLTLRSEETGSYKMHTGGEIDVRATFCASVVATLLDLDIETLFPRKTLDYVLSCQTHEGGIGCDAVGGTEAHGGYTQCGVSAAVLLRSMSHIQKDIRIERELGAERRRLQRLPRQRRPPGSFNMPKLRKWLSRRQRTEAGGFNGRTNKLVDSCYSFWIGSSCVMCEILDAQEKLLCPVPAPEGFPRKGDGLLSFREVLALDLGQMVDLNLMVVDLDELSAPTTTALDRVSRFGMEEPEGVADQHSENWFDLGSKDDAREGPASLHGDWSFNQVALQHYVLQCCQHRTNGGLMDKPDHPNDSYHTCYSLSGTSLATNCWLDVHTKHEAVEEAVTKGWLEQPSMKAGDTTSDHGSFRVLVNPEDETGLGALSPTNPVINLVKQRVVGMLRHFKGRSFI